MFKNMTQKIQ
uniref:Truncated superantigen-like protein X n=1 Tax=Staphylococcus aureus TaxID=1280 RepID=A0A125RA06_STAAU|nr:truncated superantigen-like protein X [Staphylococcus aureus]